jgi:hypothetical protein
MLLARHEHAIAFLLLRLCWEHSCGCVFPSYLTYYHRWSVWSETNAILKTSPCQPSSSYPHQITSSPQTRDALHPAQPYWAVQLYAKLSSSTPGFPPPYLHGLGKKMSAADVHLGFKAPGLCCRECSGEGRLHASSVAAGGAAASACSRKGIIVTS